MIRPICSFAVLVALSSAALAQTPLLQQGPATPNQRISAATEVAAAVVPEGSIAQAQQQASGNYGELSRPASVGGQIQEAWSSAGARAGAQVEYNCGDCTYKVRLRQFMVTAIQLPEGVKIKTADLGDGSLFEVKKRSDNTLAVKPVGAGVDSSMLVYTEDGDVFSFYLRSEGINSKHVPDLTFRIVGAAGSGIGSVAFDTPAVPGDPLSVAAVATYGATDFLRTAKFNPAALRGWNDYKLWGDRKLRPEQVFRDDNFTYIQFGDKWNDLELPTAYVVVDGIDELVNTRVQGTTFIVESTHKLITLKSGASFMCIQYKGE